jgi:hypothetical protein
VRRTILWTLGAVCCVAAAIVAVLVFTGAGGDGKVGLPPQKIAELARFGITPQEYLRARQRGNANEAALKTEPPPNPYVVAPRVIRESHGPELLAWKKVFEAQLHSPVAEVWHVQLVNETHAIVRMQLLRDDGNVKVGDVAEWALNFALTRPLTHAEELVASGPHGEEALNAMARKLGTLPQPRRGRKLPVRIYAVEGLSPGLHEVIVSIVAPYTYESHLIMRRGTMDEALLRGKTLVNQRPKGEQYLKLSKHVRFYRETSQEGPVKRSSIYELSRLFNKGLVPLLLGWRSGARNLHELLRRPIEEVIILP